MEYGWLLHSVNSQLQDTKLIQRESRTFSCMGSHQVTVRHGERERDIQTDRQR